MSVKNAPNILYIVYWGAAEPLGQSLVLPAVKKLAALGARLTLVTFEKPSDIASASQIESIREELAGIGVNWYPLQYHKKPKIPATAWDIAQGVAYGLKSRLKFNPDIIHARTFIGGLIGMALAMLSSAKLIYHAEGFYPDEEVDGGTWQAGSVPHLLASWLDRQMYSRSDGVIVLSNKAKQIIERIPAVEDRQTPILVVPSCINLDYFRWKSPSISPRQDDLRLIYIGNVGKRYLLDKLARFVAVAAQENERIHFRILSRADSSLVASMLNHSGLSNKAWSLDSVPYASIPEELSRHQAGLHFLRKGLSEHAGSPTKIGEYWAAGLPVVVTANAGDTDEIINRERVGVIVREHSDSAYRQAFTELRELLQDPGTPDRCRRAAENNYALDAACERQFVLYNKLMNE